MGKCTVGGRDKACLFAKQSVFMGNLTRSRDNHAAALCATWHGLQKTKSNCSLGLLILLREL